jgi:hypothetical protein
MWNQQVMRHGPLTVVALAVTMLLIASSASAAPPSRPPAVAAPGDGLAVASLNGTVLAIVFAGLVGFFVLVNQLLNDKTTELLDDAHRLSSARLGGYWRVSQEGSNERNRQRKKDTWRSCIPVSSTLPWGWNLPPVTFRRSMTMQLGAACSRNCSLILPPTTRLDHGAPRMSPWTLAKSRDPG